MLQQIDRIEHNVAVSAGILCAAVSLAVAVLIAHEVEVNGNPMIAAAAFVVIYFGANRFLRRGLK
jgi:hypothetical protein